LDEQITLQLAVQGSHSKINHSVLVDYRYQDIQARRTFFAANLSGYDMILGTSWLFQHKVNVVLNPTRVFVGSADSLPLQRIATAKVHTGAVGLEEDVLQAAREDC
jgi:hypothetical protein